MSTRPRQSRQLNFKELPLIEAAVRLSLEKPLKLTFHTINALHDKIREDFPLLTEPDRIEAPPGITGAQIAIGPGVIVGATYAGHADGLLVTLQQQSIGARWLKQRRDDAPEYPRFEKLRDALWSCLDACDMVLDAKPTIAVVNMFYANLIKCTNPSEVLRRYFSPEAHIGAFKKRRARAIQKVEFAWREPDEIDLRFALEAVTVDGPDGKFDAYKLTTASGALLSTSSESDPKELLEVIHGKLLSFFEEIISEEARAEWVLEESND